MTPEAKLTDYLAEHIPLSRALGAEVTAAALGEVVVRAPFEPNVNHQCTVFGGSASAIAILAAWSLLHFRMAELGLVGGIVIQRNSMEYLEPFAEQFEGRATFDDEAGWTRFEKTLARRGKARLVLSAELFCKGRRVGAFEGAFVAIRP